MQEYLADLHIHSRFSRATSRKLSIPLLAAWAGIKGIAVLGTGDFTHPKWREELRRDLRFDEASGLYVPADPALFEAVLPGLPAPAGAKDQPAVRFMLQGEISSIYKRGGKVRKVHNLVFMPTLEAAEAFSLRLGELGNLHSDGRPILGLDSRDLLELVLEAHPKAFLIPAHIWTPWFSLFGSRSGFDRLEDCFGDLSPEIFALETGLSSDPAMNRLWSALDGRRLVSNSDAHSAENLGREANLFAGALSYDGMLNALKFPLRDGSTRFLGTLEFFPEEGKYHMDGHRKCGVVLTPGETRECGGICPVCGGPLTVGVLSRVMELSDREEPAYQPEDGSGGLGAGGFVSLVPLAEMLSEILGVGPKSRTVGDMYAKTLERFGPELTILRQVPEADLARYLPPLGEAVGRMRRGKTHLQGGYDGEYGVVRLFTDEERRHIARGVGVSVSGKRGAARGLALPGMDAAAPSARAKGRGRKAAAAALSAPDDPDPAAPPTVPAFDPGEEFMFSDLDEQTDAPPAGREALSPEQTAATSASPIPAGPEDAGRADAAGQEAAHGLNPEQERAVMAGPGPVLVLAGPGTGKTRTLVARILHLLDEGIGSRRILAVTFTRRAAMEMDRRLAEALGSGAPLPRTDTLHALALELWHKTHADVPVLLSEESARRVFAEANPEASPQLIREAWQAVNLARERMELPAPDFVEMGRRYMAQKNGWNLADYTDLLEFWLEQIAAGLHASPWGHVLVDEVQDLSPLQLALVHALSSSSGEGFFGIGDPDQSIYGFRGASGDCLDFFRQRWPGLDLIRLSRNYRSRRGIPELAHAALGPVSVSGPLATARSEQAVISLFEAPTAEAEAAWVADRAAALIGMGSHTLADAREHAAERPAPEPDHSPGDIAVLVRTHALAVVYRKALARKGLPVAEPAGDAFWADERVALLLRAAGRMLGIAAMAGNENDAPVCPDKVVANGPLGVSAYLADFPPFDALFWRSRAFRSLVRAYDENKGWAGLITWISLQTELELVRAKGEKIQVISLHAAKGLEFRSVFLPCLEDGILPYAGPDLLAGKPADKIAAADTAEERRLFYVGLTRAKDFLYLSRAGKRSLYGHELRLKASRFLEPLPGALLTRSALVARTVRKEESLSLI